MPQVHTERRPVKKLAAAIAIGVIVLVVGGVFLVKYLTRPQVATDQVLSNVQDDLSIKNFAGAQKAINDQLPHAKNKHEKMELYLSLGAVYLSDGKPSDALDSLKQAEAAEPSYGIIDAEAQAAVEMHDNKLAISYLHQELDLLKSGVKTSYPDEETRVTKQIAQLSGSTQ